MRRPFLILGCGFMRLHVRGWLSAFVENSAAHAGLTWAPWKTSLVPEHPRRYPRPGHLMNHLAVSVCWLHLVGHSHTGSSKVHPKEPVSALQRDCNCCASCLLFLKNAYRQPNSALACQQ